MLLVLPMLELYKSRERGGKKAKWRWRTVVCWDYSLTSGPTRCLQTSAFILGLSFQWNIKQGTWSRQNHIGKTPLTWRLWDFKGNSSNLIYLVHSCIKKNVTTQHSEMFTFTTPFTKPENPRQRLPSRSTKSIIFVFDACVKSWRRTYNLRTEWWTNRKCAQEYFVGLVLRLTNNQQLWPFQWHLFAWSPSGW